MFNRIKAKNEKLGNALETFVKALIGAVLGFLSGFFLESCKTFDFSAEKLEVQVQSKESDLINQTFDLNVEQNNSSL